MKAMKIGDLEISSLSSEKKDWNFYSKSWHRRFGPKKTITNAVMVAYSDRIDSLSIQSNRLTENNCLSVLIDREIIKSHAAPRGLKKVQRNAAFRVDLISSDDDIEIYSLSLELFSSSESAISEYCAYNVQTKTAFHADSIESAVSGSRAKITAKITAKKERRLISIELCEQLKFCKNGVADVIETLRLDASASYTSKQLIKLFSELNTSEQRRLYRAYDTEFKQLGVKI